MKTKDNLCRNGANKKDKRVRKTGRLVARKGMKDQDEECLDG